MRLEYGSGRHRRVRPDRAPGRDRGSGEARALRVVGPSGAPRKRRRRGDHGPDRAPRRHRSTRWWRGSTFGATPRPFRRSGGRPWRPRFRIWRRWGQPRARPTFSSASRTISTRRVAPSSARGLAAVAADHSVAVLGGDVTRAPALTVALTVVGHAVAPAELVTPLRRSFGRCGGGDRRARRRGGGTGAPGAPGARGCPRSPRRRAAAAPPARAGGAPGSRAGSGAKRRDGDDRPERRPWRRRWPPGRIQRRRGGRRARAGARFRRAWPRSPRPRASISTSWRWSAGRTTSSSSRCRRTGCTTRCKRSLARVVR